MAIREKVWKCAACGTDNLGRYKECPTCGSPREKGEMRSMKGQGTSVAPVTDPELLKLARAGSDWFCTHCTAGNVGNGDRCSKCGAPRYATAEEDHPDFAGAHKRVEGADAKLDREINRDARADTVSSEPPPEPPRPPRQPPPPPTDTWEPVIDTAPARPWGLITAALVGGTLLLGFFIWAMQTHEVPGTVTSMTWTRAVHVETWTDITVRLFKKDTTEKAEVQPRNGTGARAGITFMGGCKDEYYKTIQVACGSHQECKDVYRTEQESYSCSKPGPDVECGETCTDLGNGFEDCSPKYCSGPDVSSTCYRDKRVFDHKECGSVTDYCDKKIYEPKCEYKTQEWQASRTYSSSGSGTNLYWEEASVGPLQRATYSATTNRVISYVDGQAATKEYPTSVSHTSKSRAESSASEYLTWKIGEQVTIAVNNLGSVVGEPHRGGVQ